MNNGVQQLTSLTFRYCRHGGSSRGMRDFIRELLVPYATKHSTVQMTTINRNGKHPIVVGKYVCGNEKEMDVKNFAPDEIEAIAERLRRQSGRKKTRLDRPLYTQTPSIQGFWRPNVEYKTDLSQDIFAVREAHRTSPAPSAAASSG